MRMARRSGGTHKGVEEKRRAIPIYQHYTLSPGKTKSHHPEAKCNHCLKEFVCGSKQRLIRHIRKCNSITNPDQIIAETLNTLARSSATGQLNQSILEASNLLPSQISHIQHPTQQHLVSHHHHHHQHLNSSITTANISSNTIDNYCQQNNINETNHNNGSRSSLSSDQGIVVLATTPGNGGSSISLNHEPVSPAKRPQKRGRKPGNSSSNSPGIHVTTGSDGKSHFTPASQLSLPHLQAGPVTVNNNPLSAQQQQQQQQQLLNGRGSNNIIGTTISSSTGLPVNVSSVSSSANILCTTSNHHHLDHHQLHHSPTLFKLNSEPIDKAYLKLVLTRNLPISLCDTKEFQAWVRTLANDNYKPPSSINLIAQNLKREAQLARQKVSNILVKASKKTINLELHCWPDDIRNHHWYAMIAGVDQRRFLVSVRDTLHRCSSMNNVPNNINRNGLVNHHINSNNNNNTNALPDAISANGQSDRILTEFVDECIKRVGSDRINSLMFSGKKDHDQLALRARQALYKDHPSIVTYHCWWHFTNLICSDIMENIQSFKVVLKNSNLLIDLIVGRPIWSLNLEKFGPFAGATGSLNLNKQDSRWYAHLVCYQLEYLKNNHEAILRAFEAYSYTSSQSSSLADSNNNNNNNSSSSSAANNLQSSIGTQQQQVISYHEGNRFLEAKAIVTSNDFWTNLNSAIDCLGSLRDLICSSSVGGFSQTSSNPTSLFDYSNQRQQTPTISPITSNNLTLGEYMNWFLAYGRRLFETSTRSTNNSLNHQIIRQYLKRFCSSLSDFNLMFAAYLLNPKFRCAYMTQKAKDMAIEEILNVASEFMPEESDGHTIFDQWKLYLGREEPYSVAFDESCSSPLDWWMSVPCAESIRRVALRILRLKAFTSPKPENFFSQLYFYEDETATCLNTSNYEDLAVLRYFYDYEDKTTLQQTTNSFMSHNINSHNNITNHLSPTNGHDDRSHVGQVHNNHLQKMINPPRPVANDGPPLRSHSNGTATQSDGSSALNGSPLKNSMEESNRSFGLDQYDQLDVSSDEGSLSDVPLESLPGYEEFVAYIDFNQPGVQIIEEPIEKKKRKWTAQEIISKCQSNSQSNNNNNNIDINNKGIKSS